MEFVKSPNLPDKDIKLAVTGNNRRVIDALYSLGTKVFVAADNINIQEQVKTHADMTLLHLGNHRFITYDTKLADYLHTLGADVAMPEISQSASYPQDVGVNCLILADSLVCNTAYCAGEVLDDAKIHCRKVINVKQGYARCSVAVIDEKSVITADKGIAEKMSGEGFDVLCIRPGYIELPGYDHGFIGGCCGKLSRDKILFCGDPMNHPDGKLITEFITERNIKIITTDNLPLFDFGGIIQILE